MDQSSNNDITVNIMDIYEELEENLEIDSWRDYIGSDRTILLLQKKSNEMRIFPFDVLFSILYKIRNKCHVGGLVGYLDINRNSNMIKSGTQTKFKMYENTSSIIGDIFNNGIRIIKDTTSIDSDFYEDMSGIHEIQNTACGLYGFIQTMDMYDDKYGYKSGTVEISNNSVINRGILRTNIEDLDTRPTLSSLYPFSYISTETSLTEMAIDISYNYALFQRYISNKENTNGIDGDNLEAVVLGVDPTKKGTFLEQENINYLDNFVITNGKKNILFKTTSFIDNETNLTDKLIINKTEGYINILFSIEIDYEQNYWAEYEAYMNDQLHFMSDNSVIYIIFLEKGAKKSDFGEDMYRKHKFKKIDGVWKILIDNETKIPADFNKNILSTPFTQYYIRQNDTSVQKYATYQFPVVDQNILNGWHFIDSPYLPQSYTDATFFIDKPNELLNKTKLDLTIDNDTNILSCYLSNPLLQQDQITNIKHNINTNIETINDIFASMSMSEINDLLD